MKTGTITIAGNTYLTCLSTRALMRLQDKGKGSIEKVFDELVESGSLSETFELLYMLMDAGARYAKLAGIENPPLISYDEMIDTLGIDDLPEVQKSLAGAIVASAPDIETVPEKK